MSPRYTHDGVTFQLLTGSVLGDRASTKEIASMVKDAYGIEPKMESLGSMDDLFKEMTELRAKNPDTLMAWAPKYTSKESFPLEWMLNPRHRYYEYYTTCGKTSVPRVDNARYPSVRVETMRDFLGRHKLADLPNAINSLTLG